MSYFCSDILNILDNLEEQSFKEITKHEKLIFLFQMTKNVHEDGDIEEEIRCVSL